MCGFISIYHYQSPAHVYDKEQVIAARESMQRRGPDAAGIWRSKEQHVTLAHRRLAIIDLADSSNQPMQLHHEPVWIVFNGEIYNYKSLRAELMSQGYRFRTQSDTEVILNLYLRDGVDCVTKLRGMFAFAIWDDREQTMLLARDPLGIKPLYYIDDGESLIAASQVKALRTLIPTLTPDPAGHLGFFIHGYVPDPFTMFREVRALPAGTLLYRQGERKVIKKYFDPIRLLEYRDAIEPNEHDDSHAIVREVLKETMDMHLIADVDVGLFLSSGVDSTTLAWLAAHNAPDRIRAITLGTEEYQGTDEDEVPLARAFADRIGTRFNDGRLTQQQFIEESTTILHCMDQPSTDGVNTYFVSKLAADNGLKVAISGLGGDELFRGYSAFSQVPDLVRYTKFLGNMPWVGRTVRHLTAPLFKHFTSPKYASMLEYGPNYSTAHLLRRALYLPWELRCIGGQNILNEAWEQLRAEELTDDDLQRISVPEAKVSLLELTGYMRGQLLRDSDWAGMAHSVEIRVPFVDSQLFSSLAPMIRSKKGLLKQDIAKAVGHPMTREIVERPKTGLGLPIREWLMEERGITQRGLRGWGNTVYRDWCEYNRCQAIITPSDQQIPSV